MWQRPTARSMLIFAFALPCLAYATGGDSPRVLQVNCDRGDSLGREVRRARPGATLLIKGTCNETVVIETDDLALIGKPSATVDAGGTGIPIVVKAAQRVSISSLALVNGTDGLLVTENAAVTLRSLTLRDNAAQGIHVTGSSNAKLSDISITQSGVDGLRVSDNANAVITGSITSTSSTVFGLNVLNNGSIFVEQGDITLNGNTIGLQVAVNSSLFIDGEDAGIDASDNFVVGITVVSNSELFAFKSALVANRNGLRGASLFSGSNIELDNGASLDANGNVLDGIFLEGSGVNVFNMAQEPGSTIVAKENGRFGIFAGKTSTIDVTGASSITATNNGSANGGAGVFIDDGSRALLTNSELTGNQPVDLGIEFGSRAEVNDTTVNVLQCDSSALVRGNENLGCPLP